MNLGPVLVGAISIGVSLALLALMAVWASLPSAKRAVTPAPDRPGMRYRCYCWKEPVVVFVEAPPAPTVEAPPAPMVAAPPAPMVAAPPAPGYGAPPAPRIPAPAPRGCHAKPRGTVHAARPDSASLAGAGGRGRGAPPVSAVV